MQTILGAGGVIGNGLAKELSQYTNQIRLVSRNPKKINETDEVISADLTNEADCQKAVEGSEIVYLTAGLPYRYKVWNEAWPKLILNVIEACKEHKSKLVFFDNVYMYGLVDGWMTEKTPVNPCSKKGEIRKRVAEAIMNEVETGMLTAQIVRAADFYGPGATNSVFNLLIIENFKKGKKANWMANDQVKHTFTYTQDAARATAILGNTKSAYNQVWHLPTHPDALNGKEYIELTAELMNVMPNYQVLKKWMLTSAGIFDKTIRELPEMIYQQEHEYLFSSEKFEKAFDFEPTTYQNGIKETVQLSRV